MKSEFSEFYGLSEDLLVSMWTEGLVIFDTNALLRLYRYRENTVEEIFRVLDLVKDRAWCPYQVGWEYQKNRFVKIREAEKSFQDAMKDFENAFTASSNRLRGLKEFGIHPKLGLDSKVYDLAQYVDSSVKSIRSEYDKHPLTEYFLSIHDRVGEFYQGKLGPEPDQERLNSMISAAQIRINELNPPGLIDAAEKQKAGAEPRSVYGDVLVWFEIMECAKSAERHVIFVTEDNKEDWWQKEQGKTIGPLPFLRREFRKEVGKQVYFYSVAKFLDRARHYLNVSVSEDSVVDARETASHDVNFITIEELDNAALSASTSENLLQDIRKPEAEVWPIVDPSPSRGEILFNLLRTRERAYKLLQDKKRTSENLRAKWMEYPAEVRAMNVSDMPPNARTASLVYFNSKRILRNAEEKFKEADDNFTDYMRASRARR
ncbi:PIN domain-containing protein [Methylobacterium sp. NMS12]|uniref:PIN-like domain-containing protein n=1 Tax=Methylobacterium sp. NMS12 TaxID=3079766 RepID=UPI003F8855D0